MAVISIKLREIRRQKELSQEDLANRLGISRQAVIALEQGVSLPSLPVLIALLRVLEVPFAELCPNMPDWSPFHVYESSQSTSSNELTRFNSARNQSIAVSMNETNDEIVVEAELAGVREEDLAIDLGSQHIFITAVKKPANENHQNCHIDEIGYGPLMRVLSLPSPIDTGNAKADFNHGILVLRLPKLTPTAERRITFDKGGNHGSE